MMFCTEASRQQQRRKTRTLTSDEWSVSDRLLRVASFVRLVFLQPLLDHPKSEKQEPARRGLQTARA